MKFFIFSILLIASLGLKAQENSPETLNVEKILNKTLSSKWYEKIHLKGYSHFRYNRLFETNSDLSCSACDKSIGDKQGFFLRRARLTFLGEINDKVYIYIQPDFASDANGTQNYFQIRDAYFDYALTENKEWRIRSGISKVPFGFSNLQSSSNRGPLDRDDAINSAAPNERDIGVYFMYAPTHVRLRFKELTSNNLKGTGDYGMLAIGAYNGQTLNKPEKNNDLHRIMRLTYPFKLESGQFIEASIQAYEGKYAVTTPAPADIYDQRSAASFIYYPQPFGFQVEYNIGVGPEYDPEANAARLKNLRGGYAQINYQTYYKDNRFFPFLRYQEYEGGRKQDAAVAYRSREWELGTEWQPHGAFEFTAAYGISDRLAQSATEGRDRQNGNFLRLQAQFNY